MNKTFVITKKRYSDKEVANIVKDINDTFDVKVKIEFNYNFKAQREAQKTRMQRFGKSIHGLKA